MADQADPPDLTQPDADGQGKQRKQAMTAAAAAIGVGRTVKQAARAAGVDERTIYRWQKLPAFRRQVALVRDRLVGQTVGLMTADMTAAARCCGSC